MRYVEVELHLASHFVRYHTDCHEMSTGMPQNDSSLCNLYLVHIGDPIIDTGSLHLVTLETTYDVTYIDEVWINRAKNLNELNDGKMH